MDFVTSAKACESCFGSADQSDRSAATWLGIFLALEAASGLATALAAFDLDIEPHLVSPGGNCTGGHGCKIYHVTNRDAPSAHTIQPHTHWPADRLDGATKRSNGGRPVGDRRRPWCRDCLSLDWSRSLRQKPESPSMCLARKCLQWPHLCVATTRYQHSSNPWLVEAGIKDEPLAAKICSSVLECSSSGIT
jgi:hypothetical protein